MPCQVEANMVLEEDGSTGNGLFWEFDEEYAE